MQKVTAGLLYGIGYGVGYSDVLSISSPAAGAAQSFTVDGSYALRVLAARASITTDANVANRFVSLDYINGRGITYCRNAAGVVVTASTTAQAFEWNAARAVAEWASNAPVLIPCLPSFLMPGDTVKWSVDNIQATDQLSGLVLYVEKFETGELGYELGAIDAETAPRPALTF